MLSEPHQTTGVLDLSKDSDDSDDEGEVAPQVFMQEDRNENDSNSDSDSDDESDGDPDDQASEGQERVSEQVIVEEVDENDPSDHGNDSPGAHVNESAKLPRPSEILGRGMRIRKQPVNYQPGMTGKSMSWESSTCAIVATGTS